MMVSEHRRVYQEVGSAPPTLEKVIVSGFVPTAQTFLSSFHLFLICYQIVLCGRKSNIVCYEKNNGCS